MKPTIRIARRACEAAKARQAVVVWFDEHGQFAVASYGETVAECSAVKPVCNAIADAFDAAALPSPKWVRDTELASTRSDKRRGSIGDWREYEQLRALNEELLSRAQAAEKFRDAVATLVAIYERQRVDEPEEGWPEGYVSPRQVLIAIAETIGNECSFCRRRHGSEIQHAAE
jgi:hypothetical protein